MCTRLLILFVLDLIEFVLVELSRWKIRRPRWKFFISRYRRLIQFLIYRSVASK